MFNQHQDTILPLDYNLTNSSVRYVRTPANRSLIWRLFRWVIMQMLFAMLPTILFTSIAFGIIWWNFPAEVSAVFKLLTQLENVSNAGGWLDRIGETVSPWSFEIPTE